MSWRPAVSASRPRPDVGPTSWEVPTAAVVVWLTAGALLLPVGRAAVALATGGGWVWPTGSPALVVSVGGLLTGDPAAGLDHAQAAALPGRGTVYGAIATILVLFLAGTGAAAFAAHRFLGGGAGMATRDQVAEVLGSARLRQAAPIIRPDLPGGRRRRDRTPIEREVGW